MLKHARIFPDEVERLTEQQFQALAKYAGECEARDQAVAQAAVSQQVPGG
jgi:hypothetical protein